MAKSDTRALTLLAFRKIVNPLQQFPLIPTTPITTATHEFLTIKPSPAIHWTRVMCVITQISVLNLFEPETPKVVLVPNLCITTSG